MPNGAALTRLVDAAVIGTAQELAAARHEVRMALGDAAFVDAAATLASFNAIVKIADGSGIPLEAWKEQRTRDLREALSLQAFQA